MSRSRSSQPAVPAYLKILRAMRHGVTVFVVYLLVAVVIHTIVTWPNPLAVIQSVVLALWLAWRIGWCSFVRRYARRRGLDDPGW